MSFVLDCKLHKKFETESKSATFQAREFVVSTLDGSYVQYVKFQLVQDKCELIDGYEEGQEMKVHFDLRGREWQGKYFTNLQAWKIESANAQAMSTPPPAVEDNFPTLDDAPAAGDDSAMDDLPF